jgi:hypothetical protein
MSRSDRRWLVSMSLAFLLAFGILASADTPSRALAAILKKPMLVVARLITQEKFSPNIDEMLKEIPSAQHLGDRWTPSNPAWERARSVITGRLDRIADAYGDSDLYSDMLQSEIERTAGGDTSAALTKMLGGPAGPSILRSQAMIQFVSTVMADEPDSPKIGDPAWHQRLKALSTTFSDRAGAAIPPDDPSRAADVQKYFSSPEAAAFRSLWNGVVGKATVKLDGAMNLMMFDDREAIMRELDAAVASAK